MKLEKFVLDFSLWRCYNTITKQKEEKALKIYTEYDGPDFEFWSGGKQTAELLTDDEITQIFELLEDCYPNGMSATEVNDFFWFEEETVAEWLGWPSFDTLYKARTGGYWYTLEEWEEEEEE